MNTNFFYLWLLLTFFLLSCEKNIKISSEENYGYENWPGKNGIVKFNIEFPTQLISEYDLTLTAGSIGDNFFYKVSLHENDTIKNGRLQVQVFSTIEAAQLALVEYLNILTTPFKPSRLTNEDFKAGDVAFGEENDGILRVAFARNNVMVIIYAPTEKAKEIAKELDKSIINALEWTKDMPLPSFVLP